MIFRKRPYTLKLHRSRFRTVHAALIGLSLSALAIPLISNWNVAATARYDGIAKRGFVATERPFDRLLSGQALGGRRLTDPALVTQIVNTKTTPAPDSYPALTPHIPDMPETNEAAILMPPLLEQTADAPVPVEREIVAADALAMPFPRQKPTRTASASPEKTITSIALPPLEPIKIAVPENSIALNLPESAPAPEEAPGIDVAVITPRVSSASGPRIAIVLAAAGLNATATRSAIQILPDTVTLAFAPIGEQTPSLSKEAAADGHLVLAEIPMEPMNASRDPGEPLTLRVSNTEQENIQRLRKALARVSGAKGVSSYLGARFSRSDNAAAPVIAAMKDGGYFFFENQPSHQSRLASIAQEQSLPYAAGRLVIDTNQSQIAETLAKLEAQSQRDGFAIAVGATYANTIDALAKWMKSAESRGITFVPVTEVAE